MTIDDYDFYAQFDSLLIFNDLYLYFPYQMTLVELVARLHGTENCINDSNKSLMIHDGYGCQCVTPHPIVDTKILSCGSIK